MAQAHFRLGHISRMLEDAGRRRSELPACDRQFERLVDDNPLEPEYRQALANAYNWLGETLRPLPAARGRAEAAYATRAGAAAGAGRRAQPEMRRISRSSRARTTTAASCTRRRGVRPTGVPRRPKRDFREAIRLLEPLGRDRARTRRPAQELARAFNNLASLLASDARTAGEAERLYEQRHPDSRAADRRRAGNREYKLELAKFSNNLADLLARARQTSSRARSSNDHALGLLDDLVRPAPSLGIEQADAHNLRGGSCSRAERLTRSTAYREALRAVRSARAARGRRPSLPDFMSRFVRSSREPGGVRRDSARAPDARAVAARTACVLREFGREIAASGYRAEVAQTSLDNVSRLCRQIGERSTARLIGAVSGPAAAAAEGRGAARLPGTVPSNSREGTMKCVI